MLTIVVAAEVEPVTLAHAREHLRVFQVGDDAMIARMITAAREFVELATGRALAVASYSWTPPSHITTPTPLRPSTITSAAGVLPILFTTVPGLTPAALRAAILLIVGDLYESAEANIVGTIVAENPTLQNLMSPFRNNMGV